MGKFENSIYVDLEREFEENLNRKLKEDEKEFLEWLAKKHTRETKEK